MKSVRRFMQVSTAGLAICVVLLLPGVGRADAQHSPATDVCHRIEASTVSTLLKPLCVVTESSVHGRQGRIDYVAVAGTLVVHPAGWDDAAPRAGMAEGAMSYVAYLKKPLSKTRPIMFLYNGGPGTPTMWLHLGAFGPWRAVFDAASQTPDASYTIKPNRYTLLDSIDLVFIDAPGTGFGRIAGEGREKAFWGTDADAHAFEQFITTFLSLHGRWAAPKYLFGESFGTLRSAILINRLEHDNVRFNGVLLMSQILELGYSSLFAGANPGMEQMYALEVPSFAATAWYFKMAAAARNLTLPEFLREVERFVDTEYLPALLLGTDLDASRKHAIAQHLSSYTGLPVDYILKSNLRITGPQFAQALLDDDRMMGQLDSRFVGSKRDPLNKQADYDPTMSALAPVYVSASNAYWRDELQLGTGLEFHGAISLDGRWDFSHDAGQGLWSPGGRGSAVPDLAAALIANPKLKVAVFSGYYDLNTPYYQASFELRHLPIPAALRADLERHYYEAGHMIYADEASLAKLSEDVCDFVRRTSSGQVTHAAR